MYSYGFLIIAGIKVIIEGFNAEGIRRVSNQSNMCVLFLDSWRFIIAIMIFNPEFEG